MLDQIQFPKGCIYKNGQEHEPINFFIETLPKSKTFDLLLGYFSSSAINVLAIGFAHFIANGGTMRVIINDVLSALDKDLILKGKDEAVDPSLFNPNDLLSIKKALDNYGNHFFDCIAWLIAQKRIEIVAIRPKGKNGISHYKSGTFSNNGEQVHFTGSCNFTANALLENLEEINVRRSWVSSSDQEFITKNKEDFEEIFSGGAKYVDYINIEDIKGIIHYQWGNKDLNDLLIQEAELTNKKKLSLLKNTFLQKSLEELEVSLLELHQTPRFPYPEGPRPYQMEAYQNWQNKDFKGIFAMATGTGKTITSLNCLLQEYSKSEEKVYHALILVPTITLVNQWEEEVKQFNFREVIKVSSKTTWESELATVLSTSKRIPLSFVVISTYASFIKDRFNKYLKSFPEDTIFIADEAHNIGSQAVLTKLPTIKSLKRIGLSATPKRVYDIDGTAAMINFFSDSEPFTYSFSMERAIEEGILCKYYYYPHIVKLTPSELHKYLEITNKLAKFYDSKNEGFDLNDIVEKLLLKRKRIIHKAVNKLSITISILKERLQKEKSLKYTFVYVPEGVAEEGIEIDSDQNVNSEEVKLINQYTREIAKLDEGLMVNQFTSVMEGRDEILNQFRSGKIDVIASMKCLDEGVDIPRAEHAIFCSSTGNPRQFIQRRGRILRKHPEKSFAVIHDLVVIPDTQSLPGASNSFNAERSLVKKELERVMYFASLSLNPFSTEEIFQETCEQYDLNIYTIFNELKTA